MIKVGRLIDKLIVTENLVFEDDVGSIQYHYIDVAEAGFGQCSKQVEFGKAVGIGSEDKGEIEIAFGMHCASRYRTKQVDSLDIRKACKYLVEMVKIGVRRGNHGTCEWYQCALYAKQDSMIMVIKQVSLRAIRFYRHCVPAH